MTIPMDWLAFTFPVTLAVVSVTGWLIEKMVETMKQLELPFEHMTKVLVTDQFCGLSPYELQQHPMLFEDLCKEALAQARPKHDFRPTHIDVVDLKTYHAAHCTTVWAADENGMAKAIIMNWDSSD